MPDVIRHEENLTGRDFFVGDIHGCLDDLFLAMDRVGFDRTRDRLFSTGDLADRGPDSALCLTLIQEPWFNPIRGNHDELFVQSFLHENNHAFRMLLHNGGGWSVPIERTLLQDMAREVDTLPLGREIPVGPHVIGLVHAEPPAIWHWPEHLDEDDRQALMWSRKRIKAKDDSLISGIDIVVVGHTIVKQPTLLGNIVYLDTGSYTNQGRITILSGEEILSFLDLL